MEPKFTLQLNTKHFINSTYGSGNGCIREALLELYPDSKVFQGVELTNINGKHYYHRIYSRNDFNMGVVASVHYLHNDTDIVETILLSINYKDV